MLKLVMEMLLTGQKRKGWLAAKKEVPKSRTIGVSLRKFAEFQAKRDGNGNNDTSAKNER
ncbi:MAG: hypothetical protein WBG73_07120 [Coleofasciculaceae cyanobacterium]